MTRYLTFFLIAVMSLGLVFLLVTRERSNHDAPAVVVEAPASVDAGVEAGVDGGATAQGVDAGAPSAADGGADGGRADKPLRVATLGWELAAPAAAVTPGPATPPFELAPEAALDAVEARLARGGADPQGADVAVMPLPAFVAAYDRLRALEPRAFLVVGFSRGREEIRAAGGALLKPPPAGDEVKIVGLTPATAADPAMKAIGSESATVLGLFALDLLGVAPARLRFVAPGEAAKGAPFAALVRGSTDERKLAFSTADASRLVPIVAIAPRGVLESREALVRDWAKEWLDARGRVSADVPGLARRLAAKEGLPLAAGVGGAPEALVLVERLGQIDSTALEAEAALVGPLAKGAVTLETLLSRTWQLARAGGLTASAAPEPLPIDTRVVAAIAPPPKAAAPEAADADAGASFGPVPRGAVAIATYRATADSESDKVAVQIEFLASVFERASFRVTAKGGEKAAKAIATAARDRGVAASRLATAAGEPAGAFASVEVLSPP